MFMLPACDPIAIAVAVGKFARVSDLDLGTEPLVGSLAKAIRTPTLAATAGLQV
jgi:hypothetical protein